VVEAAVVDVELREAEEDEVAFPVAEEDAVEDAVDFHLAEEDEVDSEEEAEEEVVEEVGVVLAGDASKSLEDLLTFLEQPSCSSLCLNTKKRSHTDSLLAWLHPIYYL
jgi:hypothetical protein